MPPPHGCRQLQYWLLLPALLQPADSAKATALPSRHAAPWIKGASEPRSHMSHKGRHPKPLLLWLPQYFTALGTMLPAQRMESPCFGTWQ